MAVSSIGCVSLIHLRALVKMMGFMRSFGSLRQAVSSRRVWSSSWDSSKGEFRFHHHGALISPRGMLDDAHFV